MMRENKRMRAAVENPLVQTLFHAAGGLGLGLLLAPFVPAEPALVVGVALLAAAVLGHFYAVWSDPGPKH